jgi:hypothetical protein
MMNRQKRGQNVPLIYNSANILAHLIDYLNKRREVNPPKNLQIRSALPIQEIIIVPPIYWPRRVISANTIGPYCTVFVNFHILNSQSKVSRDIAY